MINYQKIFLSKKFFYQKSEIFLSKKRKKAKKNSDVFLSVIWFECVRKRQLFLMKREKKSFFYQH